MHIEKVIEEFKKDDVVRCHHCGTDIAKESWDSEWDDKHPDDHHYKSAVCGCGHKVWVKVDFFGSGHDNLLKENPDPIESMIRKVREGDKYGKE
jgi:DNA-directed RNA polymerase subunit RPC12/RpoP